MIWRCTSNNSVVLDGTSYNHDGVVKRTLSFFHELLGTATDEDRACFSLGASGEEVEPINMNAHCTAMNWCCELSELPFTTDLLLFETVARSEDGIVHTGDSSEDRSSASFHGPLEIFINNAPSAEHVAVGEVLSGDVSNW